MAISTNTFTISAGFARSDCILQLEEALSWAGLHGESVSGIVTGISVYSGGGSGDSNDYYDVKPSASSRTVGIASTCSFRVDRSGGSVSKIYVNRPGSGYQDGDTCTLSGASSGGGADISITLEVDETAYGSSSTFYSKNVDAGKSYPYGVVRVPVEADKVYGDTYFGFQMQDDNTLRISSGSGFMPYSGTHSNTDDKKSGTPTRFAGDEELDVDGFDIPVTGDGFNNGSSEQEHNLLLDVDICSDNSRDLELTAFKSGLDPNFVVFAYRVPTLTATYFNTRNYACFFLHNFTSSVYDHDYVFCAGMTKITAGTTSQRRIEFDTVLAPHYDNFSYYGYVTKRAALCGYSGFSGVNDGNHEYEEYYPAQTYPQEHNTNNDNYFYHRDHTGFGGATANESASSVDPNANYNAVIKGIPLHARMIPVPYYLPDDFVFINFDYATPNTFVDQFDTITISGSEVYTVISASYNQTTRTRGIAFCARTT